ELFCQQLQSLVSNAGLWAETQQSERDATLLVEVTRRLSATLDLEQVLDIITETAVSAVALDAAGFYRWGTARAGLRLARGPRPQPARNHDARGDAPGGRGCERAGLCRAPRCVDPGLEDGPGAPVLPGKQGGARSRRRADGVYRRADRHSRRSLRRSPRRNAR